MAILLVEDDQDLAEIIGYTLRRADFDVLTTYDGFSALRLVKTKAPTLVLLDVNLPRMDGWGVLQQLRSSSTVPVIMLTACGDDEDVVRGLRLGADDYITKPFSPTQLVARVEAVLRRAAVSGSSSRSQVLSVGDVTLDIGLHRVTVQDRTLNLTKIEFRLLHELALHEGEVVSHQELARRVWGYHEVDSGAITKSHIRNLRRKIEPDPAKPLYLETVSGLGYRLRSNTSHDMPSGKLA